MKYADLITTKKLSWGAQAFVANFPAHGAVSVVGSIVGGRRLAGSGELADIHAEMLLEGSSKRNKKQIQEFLDTIGASLNFSIVGDRLQFSGRVRTTHLGKLLALISEVLKRPRFPDAELKALKARQEGELALELQNTRAQADINLSRALFTPEHPNWEETTAESLEALKKISKKDLAAYHARAIDGSSLLISIVGDINTKEAVALCEKNFKILPKQKIELPTVVIAHSGQNQQIATTIPNKASIDYMLGEAPGVTSDHSDFPALLLGTNILGNMRGFSGRLMKTVREKEGLTYGVYSYLSGFEPTTDGMFAVWATFAPELFQKGRAAIKREVTKILKTGVTADEAKKHREMFAASWMVQLSNSGAIARSAHNTAVEGRPMKYLDEFPQVMRRVTPTQVNKVFKKYFKLEQMSESAAGPIEKKALA
jgi:zinc protease